MAQDLGVELPPTEPKNILNFILAVSVFFCKKFGFVFDVKRKSKLNGLQNT